MAFPETVERPSHGSPTWFAGGKRVFATFVAYLHGDDRIGAWLPARPGVQEMLVGSDPLRFYRPPYVGPSGWIGVYLDVDVDWTELSGLVEEAFRMVATKKLVAAYELAVS